MPTHSLRRRCFLKRALAGLGVVVVGPRAVGEPARKVNVLFVLVDDLRADGFGALGNAAVQTPHFDSIINRGCVFRRAYTMGSMVGAVCLPSRTMVLTGQSLFRAQDAPSGADPDTYTFPRAMKEAGYATVHAGKFGNSPKQITDEFDETSDPGNAAAVADTVIDFIHRRAGAVPLFLYMAATEPHDPQYAPDEFHAMYDPETIPLPETFLPYHPFDNGEMTVRDEMTLPFPRTPEAIRGKLARYYASISYLDAQFGRVVQALRAAGEFDNTLFVIAGDNGLSLGDHGLLGKQNLYEFGGMHVPLVFAGPGIGKGETEALAYLMDIFPTVCDLVGIRTPSRVEGQSLAPGIHAEHPPGPLQRGRRESPSSTGGWGDVAPDAPGVREWLYTAYKDVQRAVTNGRWKLIRYPLIDKTQLFDLRDDPHELRNIAGQPEHAARIGAMLEKLAQLQRAYADPAPLSVPDPQPAEWSPAKLTPEQIRFQVEETARSRAKD